MFNFRKQKAIREQERTGAFTANRQHDLLSASIGMPDHPGRLRGKPLAYTGVKQVYGKGKRRSVVAEQNERIRNLESVVNTLLQHLPPGIQQQLGLGVTPAGSDDQHQFGVTPASPSQAVPTQVSSNHLGPRPPPPVGDDEVTRYLFVFSTLLKSFINFRVTC